MTRNGAWTLTYFASWALAMAPVGCVTVVVLTADREDGGDYFWWLGALGGAVIGLATAKTTRRGAVLHRLLRVTGPLLLVAGVIGAVVMFLQSGVQRQTGGFLAGLGEFIFGLLGVAVALTGGGLWLAGASGPRTAAEEQ